MESTTVLTSSENLGGSHRRISQAVFALLAVLCAARTSAGTIGITNASFEQPVTTTTCASAGVSDPSLTCKFNSYAVGGGFTGWTVAGNPSDAGQLTEGSLTSLYTQNLVDSNTTIGYVANNGTALYGPGYMYQVLGATTLANTVYVLTVDVTQRMDIAANWNAPAIALKIGGVQTPLVTLPLLTPPNHYTAGNWYTETLVYTSTVAGLSIEIDLLNTMATGSFGQAIFDNVQLTSVPEPGTMIMAGIGFAMLAFGAKRKK